MTLWYQALMFKDSRDLWQSCGLQQETCKHIASRMRRPEPTSTWDDDSEFGVQYYLGGQNVFRLWISLFLAFIAMGAHAEAVYRVALGSNLGTGHG